MLVFDTLAIHDIQISIKFHHYTNLDLNLIPWRKEKSKIIPSSVGCDIQTSALDHILLTMGIV